MGSLEVMSNKNSVMMAVLAMLIVVVDPKISGHQPNQYYWFVVAIV